MFWEWVTGLALFVFTWLLAGRQYSGSIQALATNSLIWLFLAGLFILARWIARNSALSTALGTPGLVAALGIIIALSMYLEFVSREISRWQSHDG